jgi:hypothetical protein
VFLRRLRSGMRAEGTQTCDWMRIDAYPPVPPLKREDITNQIWKVDSYRLSSLVKKIRALRSLKTTSLSNCSFRCPLWQHSTRETTGSMIHTRHWPFCSMKHIWVTNMPREREHGKITWGRNSKPMILARIFNNQQMIFPKSQVSQIPSVASAQPSL